MKLLPELVEIKVIRKSLNISQKELGKLLNIPQSTISRIENGTIDPPYSKFKKIFEYLQNHRMEIEETERTAADIMTKSIYSVNSKSTIKDAIEIMNEFSISQLPIIEEEGHNLGSITAKKLQKLIIDNPELIYTTVIKF